MNEKPLSYWRNIYLMRAQNPQFKKRVEKSISIIKEFLGMGKKVYCSISGGKDSTAMAHLVWKLAPGMKFVSEKDDMDFPGEREYLESLAREYQWNMDILTPSVKLWDIVMGYDVTEDIHSKGTSFSDEYFYDLLREYQTKNKMEGVFLGLRAQESKGRLWNFKKRGEIYWNESWQTWICQPLALWSAVDVFAYLFSNNIPIMDVYFKTRFIGSPERIRKSWILPSAQSSQGQALWLKYYFPEIFDRLAILQPKLRGYI